MPSINAGNSVPQAAQIESKSGPEAKKTVSSASYMTNSDLDPSPPRGPGCLTLTMAWTFMLAGSTFLCVNVLSRGSDPRLALGFGVLGAIVFTVILIRSEIRLID